jgi:membrane-associated phospholipid phosphatase
MQPPVDMPLPENHHLGSWRGLTLWLSLNRPLAWLVGLTAALVIFLAWLPAYVQSFFWHGLQTHRLLASMTLVFSLVALSLLWSTGLRMDTWAFLFFNLSGRRLPWLDGLMWGCTQIGNGLVIVAVALALFFARHRLLAYELGLGAVTLWLVVELVKAVVHRGRPFILLSQARIVGHPAVGRSFPSGHTSQAFFMAALLAGYSHAGLWEVLLMYAVALLVGITRVYMGAHYPRDVLAGAILGSAWGLLCGMVYGYAL